MKLFDRVRAATKTVTAAQLELDYLNASTSTIDLEMRQREIDRGRFRRFPRAF